MLASQLICSFDSSAEKLDGSVSAWLGQCRVFPLSLVMEDDEKASFCKTESSTVRAKTLFPRAFYVILGRWDKAPRNNHQIAGRYQAVISIFWARSQPAYQTLAHQALVLSLLARNVWVRGCCRPVVACRENKLHRLSPSPSQVMKIIPSAGRF